MISKARRSVSARSRGDVDAHVAAASSAASTAAMASCTVPSATEATTSPVAGSTTSKRPPSEAGTSLPPTYSSVTSPSVTSRVCSPMEDPFGTERAREGSVGGGDDQVLGREQREDAGAVGGDDDLLLDPGRGEPVAGRAVRLEREDHAGLKLDGLGHAVEPGDDRPLVQPEPEAVSELQAEGGHLVLEAELRRGGPHRGDLVGADTGLDHADGGVHPLPRLGVGVPLARGGAAHAERPV